MSHSNFDLLIHKKDELYCLNDIAEKLIGSSNITEYMKKIKNKKFIDGNYYICKLDMIKILEKSKSIKAHQYKDYISSLNEKLKEVIIDDDIKFIYKDNTKHKTTKEEIQNKIENRQFIDFGSNEIIYSNNKILFFNFNDTVYFKAKDICELLGYSDTTGAIRRHIDETEILFFNNDLNINDYCNNKVGRRGVESTPLLPDDKPSQKLNKIKLEIENKTKKYIEPNTVFINESGLYSLILSSKLPQAKIFKKWVTNDVLTTIRKTGSYNKVYNAPLYDEHKLKELENQSCLYVIHVKDLIYKFGMTTHSYKRMNEHKNNLDYNEIIKIFQMPNSDLVRKVENKIKKYTSNVKIRKILDEGIEFFEVNEIYTIERILKDIYSIVEDEIEIFEKKDNNNKLDTISYIELKKLQQYEMKNQIMEKEIILANKQSEITQAVEKTKQLQLELEILKLKQNIKPLVKQKLLPKPVPKTKKCIDCPTMIAEKSTRCTPCVHKFKKDNALKNSKRPTHKQLLDDLKTLGAYTKVGLKYNVSDNTVRKWIKIYETM
jgi:prophage antirepressor-like protein